MGVLAIGMIFVAGVFPLGIRFTTIASERTTAAVAAEEAFAKIKLYARGDPEDLNDDIKLGKLKVDKLRPDETTDFDKIFPAAAEIDPNEFTYPSTDTDISQKQYYWSALFRRTERYDNLPPDDPNRLVQVIVFVSRKAGPNLKYPDPNTPGGNGTVDWPMPVKVGVEGVAGAGNELRIRLRLGAYGEKTFINDGYTIVDDKTGRLYRVLERYKEPDYDYKIVLLDRDWDSDAPPPDKVWVVPPPIGGGRQPCIAVYQKVIRF